MKKSPSQCNILFILLLFLGFIFSSCKKESQNLEAVITVKYAGDTTLVVPGAKVTLTKNDVRVEGTTDGEGVFRHQFEWEAILDVAVSKDTGSGPLFGISVIRLNPEKTAYRTVFISY